MSDSTKAAESTQADEEINSQISILSMLQANPPPDPLPDGWIMHRSRSQSGYTYYFNQFTGECKWDPPYVAPKLSQIEGLKETLASLTQDGSLNDDKVGDGGRESSPSKRSILKKGATEEEGRSQSHPERSNSNSSPSSKSRKRLSSSHHGHHESSKRSRSTIASDAPEKVRAFHILKKHRDSRRPASWRQAKITISKKEAIDELHELITILKDVANDPKELRATFEELAKTESDCTSAKRGGDLGFFGRKKMQPNFEKASFALEIGEMSDIVETSSGVHVILRLG